MPFIPAENTARFELVFTQGLQIVENVYHIQFPGSIDPTMLEDMAGALVAWWDANLKAKVSNTVSLVNIKARDLTSEGGTAIEYNTGLPSVGTNTNAALPNNVTFAIKWITGLAGRSFRGRTYHIGLVSNDLVDNNHLATASVTAYDAAYEALIDAIETAGAQLVVASFYSGVVDGIPQPRASAVLTVIDNCTINSTLDSQRRRLPERGS